jgi:ABC-type transport system substrate-binding protein
MNTSKLVTRRNFLKLAGITAGAAALAACTPQVVTQTVQVTQIQQATQVVKETSIVEVTPTNPPAIVTPQGRTLPPDAAPLEKQVQYGAAPGERKFFDYVRDIYNAYGMNMLSEPLIHNDQNFNLVPAIAESWTVGPNATYFQFVINKDAVWSDGTPVTADDVVFTWAHAANPAIANHSSTFTIPSKVFKRCSRGGQRP